MTGVRGAMRAPLPRAVLLALLILMLAAGAARAEPVPLRAHVIWARDVRVVLAADGDSLEVEFDQSVTFERHGKQVATGQVSRVYDRDLALVTLISGSLGKPKDWDDIEVLAEPTVPRLPRLRVGVPGRGRSSLLFACDPAPLAPLMDRGLYHAERSTDRFFRGIIDTTMQRVSRWPDTLEVRTFGEAADEEIALERGEIDIGVFWPGELSREMREQPQWKGFLSGFRIHEVIAARWGGPKPAPDDLSLEHWIQPAMEALNQDQFRGDLLPIRSDTLAPPPSDPPASLRFEVDASCPGKRAMERSLNRGAVPPGAGSRPNVQVSLLDVSVDPPDSLGFVSEFAIGCPVVCAPRLRPYVRSLGTNAFVDFPACRPPRRRR